MQNKLSRLCDLRKGSKAIIKEIRNTGDMRRRLMDLGFAEGSKVQCALVSPLGDPKAYIVKDTVIALRQEDSEHIICENVSS